MKRYSGRFIIKSSRIKNWDYSSPGIYFVTICTEDSEHLFGKIDEGKMIYLRSGEIAMECLNGIVKHFVNVVILESVIMPNHVHILIEVIESKTNFKQDINDSKAVGNLNSVETHHGASLQIRYQSYHFHRLALKSNQTIPKVISQFKSSVSRKIGHNEYFGWQPRFYDEIIRDEKHLLFVKNYIINNIKNWKEDKYYI